MKTSTSTSVCTGTVLFLLVTGSEAARLNVGGRGLRVYEELEKNDVETHVALPAERRTFETDDVLSSENYNYGWGGVEEISWSDGPSYSWDPFKSDAFLNAQSMEEKCQVMQRSLMTSDYYGRGDSYYFGGDEMESSFAKKCTSASENPRGTYYSRKKTCTFTFHEIQEEEGKEDKPLGDYEISTKCGDANAVPHASFKEYASSWPDECVGDFARCYTIGRDEQIFFQFLCSKNKKIPEGATHMSVDCTEDKVSNLDYYSQRGGGYSFKWSSVAKANSMEEKCTIVQKSQMYRYDYYGGYYENGEMMNACGRSDLRDYSTVKCTSSSENARGTYCANTQACTFAFHQIGENEELAENKLSSLCGESNVMEAATFKFYTSKTLGWPDECVGDMSRCYVIGRDESIYLNFLCDKSMSIPEGATHLSVDCTADKISAKERFEKAPVLDELV